ncbi:MAG: putative metal-binding motif-containing protein [Myxococcota bacterium]
MWRMLLAVGLLGCDAPDGSAPSLEDQPPVDADGDGYVAKDDCDDGDGATHPGAVEVCDAVDNNCDGLVDDDDPALNRSTGETFYADADADGFGDPNALIEACVAPSGAVTNADDCDDASAATFPGAASREGAPLDTACTRDRDRDGYGDAGDGAYTKGTDCDDREAAIHPDATEVVGDGVDQNCDQREDCYVDLDRDGFRTHKTVETQDIACTREPSAPASRPDGDCDDEDAAINPGQAEQPGDGIDQNCDAVESCYADVDGDGFRGDTVVEATDLGCATDRLRLASWPGGDCDDGANNVYPGADEIIADGTDQDCDGGDRCYIDGDGDGVVISFEEAVSSADLDCLDLGEGEATDREGDCRDDDATTYPSADEVCDDVDNDCDGATDEGVLGVEETCPARSCAAIRSADAHILGDDAYALDPLGDGDVNWYPCDMTTEGGGWTKVFGWARADDDLADFEDQWTALDQRMTWWEVDDTSLIWGDEDGDADAMSAALDVSIENHGEVLFTVDYFGVSIEDSGVWFYVTTTDDDGFTVDEDLLCVSPSATALGNYTAAEQAVIPEYACGTQSIGDRGFGYSGRNDLFGFSETVTGFGLSSLHLDEGDDISTLYEVELWVR